MASQQPSEPTGLCKTASSGGRHQIEEVASQHDGGNTRDRLSPCRACVTDSRWDGGHEGHNSLKVKLSS